MVKDHFAKLAPSERAECLRAFRTLVEWLEEIEGEKEAQREALISDMMNKYAK
jgi:hypothetical protein